MGIWIPRVKPEESKFTYALKTGGLNYDFDSWRENSTLVPASSPQNGAKHTNSVTNGA